MAETVRISFEGAFDDPSPFGVIYNPEVMPRALFSQIQRYGLIPGRAGKPYMSGKLKGTRKAFTEVVLSYGMNIEIVAPEN